MKLFYFYVRTNMNLTNKLLAIQKLDLPYDITNEINSYLFLTFQQAHQKKMHLVFYDIIHCSAYCDTCGKFLVSTIYSSRNGYEKCCSYECVDEYPGLYYCYTFLNEHLL